MRLAPLSLGLGLDRSERNSTTQIHFHTVALTELLGWIDSKGSLSLSVILVSCLKLIRIKDWEDPHHFNTTSIPITMSPLCHLQHHRCPNPMIINIQYMTS